MYEKNWNEAFEKAYAECPARDRGDFKCGHSAAWSQRQEEIDILRAALLRIKDLGAMAECKQDETARRQMLEHLGCQAAQIAREALGVKSDT